MTIANTKITAEQFHGIQEPPGFKMELVGRNLIVSPSPRSRHSNTVIQLISLLNAHITARQLGKLFTELDTEFGPLDVRRPDLLFVGSSRLDQLDPDSAATSDDADLVIEVISPGTERTDREKKFKQYAKAGIRHYWIVDPDHRTFEAYTRAGKSYRLGTKAKGDAIVCAKPFPDLDLTLKSLWW